MSDFNQCEAHEVISTPNCPICLLYERDRLQSELTAARDEAERLRAQLSDITGCACDAGSLCKYHAMATTSGRSIILRKQAEALIGFGYRYGPESIVRRLTQEEAQRLRRQADDLDNV